MRPYFIMPGTPEYQKQWREQNKERLAEKDRKKYLANKVSIKARSQERYKNKRSEILSQRSEYYRRNKNKIYAYLKTYKERNPEKIRAWLRTGMLNRIALERDAAGTFTREEWFAKCEYWGWRCYLCGREVTVKSLHLEHRKPLSRGGSNHLSNIAPSCKTCNLSKGQKTELEFKGWLKKKQQTNEES